MPSARPSAGSAVAARCSTPVRAASTPVIEATFREAHQEAHAGAVAAARGSTPSCPTDARALGEIHRGAEAADVDLLVPSGVPTDRLRGRRRRRSRPARPISGRVFISGSTSSSALRAPSARGAGNYSLDRAGRSAASVMYRVIQQVWSRRRGIAADSSRKQTAHAESLSSAARLRAPERWRNCDADVDVVRIGAERPARAAARREPAAHGGVSDLLHRGGRRVRAAAAARRRSGVVRAHRRRTRRLRRRARCARGVARGGRATRRPQLDSAATGCAAASRARSACRRTTPFSPSSKKRSTCTSACCSRRRRGCAAAGASRSRTRTAR